MEASEECLHPFAHCIQHSGFSTKTVQCYFSLK